MNLTWSETPKTRFLMTGLISFPEKESKGSSALWEQMDQVYLMCSLLPHFSSSFCVFLEVMYGFSFKMHIRFIFCIKSFVVVLLLLFVCLFFQSFVCTGLSGLWCVNDHETCNCVHAFGRFVRASCLNYLRSRGVVPRAETLEPKVANTCGIDKGHAYATVHICTYMASFLCHGLP